MNLQGMTKKELIEEIKKRDKVLQDLQSTTTRMSTLVASIPGGIVIETPDRKILQANRAFCDLFGIPSPPEALKGADCCKAAQQVKALFKNSEAFLKRIDAILAEGKVVRNEELLLEDGRIFERDYVPFKYTTGQVEHIWHYRDISAYRKAHAAHKESEARYYSLFNSSPNCVFVYDLNGKFIDANKTAQRLTGYGPADMDTLNIRDLIIEEQLPDAIDRIRRIVEYKKKPEITDYQIRRKDGKLIWIETDSSLIYKDGVPYAIMGVARDITDRMEAEQALRESMQKYQALFDQSAEGIYLLDLDGNIRDVNSVATMQIGYTKEELVRMTVYDINGEPDKLDRIIEEWKQWPSDKSFLVEDVHRHKNGTVFPVEIKTGKVHFGHDALILAMVRDVEQRRRLEEQLRQAQKMEAVGQLAGGVAHDFNNLLTVIRGYSDLLLMLDLPEKLKNPVKQIKYAGEKATQLTSQLLTFSRKQIIQPKILNLNTLITEHMKMLGRLLGEDIEIATLPHPDLANVNADPGQIEQVIMNIVINARDAMPMGGKLTIETRNIEFDATYLQIHAEARKGKFVMLAISDTGIGMDKATRQRVFEPFYTTKGREKGTGLGLATVFGIVKQNDGFIYVYSEPHQGTTFKIYLPAVDMREEEDRDGHADGLELRGQETILLVEDDISVREVTRSTLTDYGYRVLTASNGEEAIRLFHEHRDQIDLLLTDVIMPLMGGRELAETLSTEKPGLKIIFFSGYTDNSIVHHGVLDEGVEFIQKPYSHLDLAIKIRSVLDH